MSAQELPAREAMEFDVVIVGAGPAGLAAAIRLKQLAPEVSVVVARSDDGTAVAYPVGLNNHRRHILDSTVMPAPVGPIVTLDAHTLALSVTQALATVGVLTVEFFVTDPLPIVAGTIGGRQVLFVVDTLLDEIVLDRDFARKAGVLAVGGADEAVLPELSLGRLTVKNVPIHLGTAMML